MTRWRAPVPNIWTDMNHTRWKKHRRANAQQTSRHMPCTCPAATARHAGHGTATYGSLLYPGDLTPWLVLGHVQVASLLRLAEVPPPMQPTHEPLVAL